MEEARGRQTPARDWLPALRFPVVHAVTDGRKAARQGERREGSPECLVDGKTLLHGAVKYPKHATRANDRHLCFVIVRDPEPQVADPSGIQLGGVDIPN